MEHEVLEEEFDAEEEAQHLIDSIRCLSHSETECIHIGIVLDSDDKDYVVLQSPRIVTMDEQGKFYTDVTPFDISDPEGIGEYPKTSINLRFIPDAVILNSYLKSITQYSNEVENPLLVNCEVMQ